MSKLTALAKFMFFVGAALIGLIMANTAWADSAKLLWNVNGHYYQRFDTGVGFVWATAKTNCESLNAHLATITSPGEQDFVYTQLIANRGYRYHIGATRVDVESPWRWITGETWIFQYWGDSTYVTDNVRIIDDINDNGAWYNSVPDNDDRGYICEWSNHTFVGNAVVPDFNNNGASEFAALYVNFITNGHVVQIRDSLTQTLLTTQSYGVGSEPSKGMVVLRDSQGNGRPKIAVLIYTTGSPKQSIVQIKDARNNNLIKTITFLDTNHRPSAISVSPDLNNNGADEIAVLGLNQVTRKARMEMRDSKTGAVLQSVEF